MILERLKAETSAQHKQLEAKLDLLSPELSRESYSRILEKFLGFYEPLEAQLLYRKEWQELGLDPSPRRKTMALKRDLAALGLDESAVRLIPRSAHSSLPRLDAMERCVGCLYVVEGATLGGQFISKHLSALLGVGPQNGGAFFTGYGSQTGERWREFRSFCEAYASGGQDQDQIVEGARDTFQKLAAWT